MADNFLVVSLPSLEPRTDVNASTSFVATSTTDFLLYTHVDLIKDIDED